MKMKTRTIAKVQVTVEIEMLQPWSEESQLGLMYAQASRDAQEQIRRMTDGKARVLASKVTAIMVEEQ